MRPFAALAAVAAVFCTASALARAETEAVQVTHGFYLDTAISPDGKRMAVVALVNNVEQLATMTVEGEDLRILTDAPYNHEDPVWSPDGRQIAYVSYEGGGQVVWLVNADGTGARAVTPRDHHAIHPSWSADGREIIYCRNDDLEPPAKNAAEIYAVDLRTGAIRTLVVGGVNTYPALSPDGRRLAFRKMIGERNSEVWIADADGSNPRNLTNSPAFDGWPAWSPDGRLIAFATDRGGNQQIWLMSPDGSNQRRLAATPGEGIAPKWSPDGRFVYFSLCMPESCNIFRAPIPAT